MQFVEQDIARWIKKSATEQIVSHAWFLASIINMDSFNELHPMLCN